MLGESFDFILQQTFYNFDHAERYGNEQYVHGKLYNKVQTDQAENNKGECAGKATADCPLVEQIVIKNGQAKAKDAGVYNGAANCREDYGKVGLFQLADGLIYQA